jgi:hypothetical protein
MSRRNARIQRALDGTRYTGSLARPIIVPLRLYLSDALRGTAGAARERSAVQQFLSNERAAKFLLLFALFGLETDDWKGLAVRLAFAHVPGLQTGQHRGAPKKKITGDQIVKLLDGWREQNPGKPLAAAIRWSIKSGPLGGMTEGAIRKRYDLARALRNKWRGQLIPKK